MMDMVMPELGGVDAVREIRALDPAARIVMCSAMGQQAIVNDALAAGASGFITKPFTPSRVLEALLDLVNEVPA
jgi:two-component system chemotaxis response regulator CheY